MAEALLLLEPIGGVAGDMFLAAALDLGVDRGELTDQLATLGLPGWRLEVTRVQVGGIAAAHVEVRVEGRPHGERRLADLVAVVERSGLSERARAAAGAIFLRLARAEARVHGVAVEEVHFHEVGAIDSVVDVCGAVVALELLGWPRAVAAPPELGSGFVKTAHGLLPVPPPAVLELLLGLPVRPGGPPGEAVTPTGAALLAGLFEVGPLPPHRPTRIGYGAGTARWPDRPNVLRLTMGELDPPAAAPGEALVVVECNLDDAAGQLAARAIEAALEAGALDAWAAPLTMKKGRPGLLLGALCEPARRDAVARVFLTETTSLGVRFTPVERQALQRELVPVETRYGTVCVKVARLDGRVVNAQPEYEDCLARAVERGLPVKEVLSEAASAWRAAQVSGLSTA
jgi:pyridinium-3,5-bisthiocarboxylic acid mononucleotide nickel chelatase